MQRRVTATNRLLGGSCGICLGDFKIAENITGLPCKHAYHTACVDEYFKGRRDCPTCRKAV